MYKKGVARQENGSIPIGEMMIWFEFSKKLPRIDTKIFVATEDGKFGFVEITSEILKILKNGCFYDYIETEYWDAVDIGCYDLSCAKYWCYIDTIDLPQFPPTFHSD
jgi:hypothetical protein